MGKLRTRYTQENTAFLPAKLIHQAHYFCAFFEKWQKLLKTDTGSQMLFEKPNKGRAVEEHELNTVTSSFCKTSEYDSIMEAMLE